jgi:hypothetical protein
LVAGRLLINGNGTLSVNDLAMVLIALGFGAVAWLMLLVSDWLLEGSNNDRK